uniref:Rab-GAP TBC domain-containing protein n=1 Tax=Megaselia scalaris TaxID=36166 RepID=T1GYA4_MEGSC
MILGDSLTEASWSAQKTADGQIHNPALLKQTIFRGGIDPPLRCEVWKWLLVWFKREFSNEDILVLWESLWTGLPCQNFHLLLSIAILEQETQTIIENEFSFTDILKHVNDLSMSINLKYSLELAEAIFVQIRDSQGLTNKLRVIVGLDLVEGEDGDEVDGQKQEDLDDSFDDIVRELTPDEKKLKEQKLEEACEQSMFLSFM